MVLVASARRARNRRRSNFVAPYISYLLTILTGTTLEESEIDDILAAFERLGTLETGKPGPAHAALEGRYDYGILKCLLAELA